MNITPLANELWEGIGGHFDSISQALCEFVDNCIANFVGNTTSNRSIVISIHKKDNGKIEIKIEDAGTGIDNFEPVLKIGDKSCQKSPLNEHGFGLKHALATADPKNESWKIYTRSHDDFIRNNYKVVLAPYKFDMNYEIVSNATTPWPGLFNGSGTIVQFDCTETLFNTVRKGIGGRPSFETCLDYLREELGYIYSGVIKLGIASINIISDRYNKMVEAVEPQWEGYYNPKPGRISLDLGDGAIDVEYSFGEIRDSNYVKHYKKNPRSFGVEIRVNGRLLCANLFTEIWGIEKHPSYNHFLVLINLITNDLMKLPKTRTSKNGIRSGDEKLERLFEWIRNTHPEPHKDLTGAITERELVNELAKPKDTHIRRTDKRIEPDFRVFNSISSPVSVDLYVFDGSDVILYEAKKDNADIQNIYQLLMYWDGAVADGLKPTEGVLISASFSAGVDIILNLLNSMKDQNGNNYNLLKKTWNDELIQYPRP